MAMSPAARKAREEKQRAAGKRPQRGGGGLNYQKDVAGGEAQKQQTREGETLFGRTVSGGKSSGKYSVDGIQIGGADVNRQEKQIEGPQSADSGGQIKTSVPMSEDMFNYQLERAKAGNKAAIATLKNVSFDAEGNPMVSKMVDDIDPRTGKKKMSEREQVAAELFTGEGLGAQELDFDRSQIDKQLARGQQARQFQMLGLGEAGKAMRGETPSVAQMQGRAQMDQALANQFAMASSARGGPAQRMASQRGAFTNAGLMQQQAVTQNAMLRAQEMAVARDQFSAQAAGIRSGDFATAQFEGGLETNLTQMGLQREQGLLSNLSGVDAQQIQAMGMQGQFLQQNRDLAFQREQFEHQKKMGFLGTGLNVLSGGLGMAFGGGE